MRLTTWDLHSLSICSLRWQTTKETDSLPDNPVRQAAKKVALLSSLGRTTKWRNSVCNIWDEVFHNWQDINTTVKATMSLSKIQDETSRKAIEAYPATLGRYSSDAGIELFPSSDFYIVTQRGIEAWFFTKKSRQEIRRSVIPGIESFLIWQALRKEQLRNIYIVPFYASPTRMKPMIRSPIKASPNKKATIQLLSMAKNVSFPIQNDSCSNCKVNC